MTRGGAVGLQSLKISSLWGILSGDTSQIAHARSMYLPGKMPATPVVTDLCREGVVRQDSNSFVTVLPRQIPTKQKMDSGPILHKVPVQGSHAAIPGDGLCDAPYRI